MFKQNFNDGNSIQAQLFQQQQLQQQQHQQHAHQHQQHHHHHDQLNARPLFSNVAGLNAAASVSPVGAPGALNQNPTANDGHFHDPSQLFLSPIAAAKQLNANNLATGLESQLHHASQVNAQQLQATMNAAQLAGQRNLQQQQQLYQSMPRQSVGGNPTAAAAAAAASNIAGNSGVKRALDDTKVYNWVIELTYGPNKEQALLELGKKREQYDDLALVLWHSYGVMTSLLQEIISVYPLLSPQNLSASASNRVCNALALLQCVASHPETRSLFLKAHLPLFLYPFLNTESRSRSFEYLRLTSLGVIGALVKNDTPEVIAFLLTTEIIPLCLKIMESSTELSKTVAIFIIQKILLDDNGLNYICQTYDRFMAVSHVLEEMVGQLVKHQTVRLLKHVVRCYLRLSDNPDARKALSATLPEPLKDQTFQMALKDDVATQRCLSQLLVNIGYPV